MRPPLCDKDSLGFEPMREGVVQRRAPFGIFIDLGTEVPGRFFDLDALGLGRGIRIASQARVRTLCRAMPTAVR